MSAIALLSKVSIFIAIWALELSIHWPLPDQVRSMARQPQSCHKMLWTLSNKPKFRPSDFVQRQPQSIKLGLVIAAGVSGNGSVLLVWLIRIILNEPLQLSVHTNCNTFMRCGNGHFISFMPIGSGCVSIVKALFRSIGCPVRIRPDARDGRPTPQKWSEKASSDHMSPKDKMSPIDLGCPTHQPIGCSFTE